MLVSQGVEQKEGKRFVAAMEGLELRGEPKLLREFQAHENEVLSMLAGLYLALVEPRQTFRRAVSLVEEET